MSVQCPAKLKIRGDKSTGVIYAFFAMVDESEQFEVSTLSMGLAESDKAIYDAWVVGLQEMFRLWVERIAGAKVVDMIHVNPAEYN